MPTAEQRDLRALLLHPHKLIVVRRDRLGGLVHEYEQAA
jgi:hypothetical protein